MVCVMDKDMKLYYDYTVSPLGELFYKTVFTQLADIKGKKILDFGSGFAFTSNFLAKENEVIALEKNESMIQHCEKEQPYKQIHGDISALQSFEDASFDVIICHLVLEFVENAEVILNELHRLLKQGGTLSIVRHNKNGRIIQAVVQENDVKDANHLLEGGYSFSSAFGDIKYYSNETLLEWLKDKYIVEKLFGIRTLASLHTQEIQNSKDWLERMFEIEYKLMTNNAFIPIAYFNHILLIKQ